jgi:hypothetical protein
MCAAVCSVIISITENFHDEGVRIVENIRKAPVTHMTQESQHDPPVATAIPTNCYRQQIYKKRQQQQQKQQHDSSADQIDNSNNKGETFDEFLKSSNEFKITKMENMEIYKDTSCQCRSLCNLGCSVLTGLPCCHQLALADAVGHDIKEFMRSADTTDGWQQQ